MTGSVRDTLGTADWIVVAVYLVVLVVLGLVVSRRRSSPEDYFLASRSSRWPTIGLALIASNISSTALVGLAGAAYEYGIAVYDYEWMAAVILVFFCVFILPQVLQSRVFTMPQFLERRYDATACIGFAVLTLFLNVFVDAAGALYSGSLVCRILIPWAPLWLVSLLLAGAAGIYTIAGGMRAVLRTEVVQAGMLIAGATAISWCAFAQVGGWQTFMRRIDPAAISLIRPIGDPGVPWPGLVLGVPLLGFYYWCTNQFIVQRVLSARDVDQGRSGAMFAGLLKLPVLFLMVLPGTCALLLFPGLPRSDLVYPKLIVGLLPAGIAGCLVAGFMAATMTSVASTLNSASTMITMDLARRLKRDISDDRIVATGRLSTGACLLLAMLWAPQLERLPSLWQYLQAVLAYAVPPVVALFLGGVFWRGANATGAKATLLLGSLCGLALFLMNVVFQVTHLHFLYAAPILFAIDVTILVIVSLTCRGALATDVEKLHWSRQTYVRESTRLRTMPLWRNYRFHALVLLALTAWVVFAFR
ncbi:MAG: sodium:solute symporter [Steroidobacteraceae bacterium]